MEAMGKSDGSKIVNELYSFKALITENELKSMMLLNSTQDKLIDFMKADE